MQLILPGFLADGKGFSVPSCVSGLTFGFALWLFGWRWHRFWIVLASTLVAGFVGLGEAEKYQVHPLVGALVLSIITGLLSLALVRVIAFAAGGITTVLLAQILVPAWNQPVVSFLLGGLLGVFLLRLWMTAVTSCGGSLLMVYSSLYLLDRLHKLDAAGWAERHTDLLNWVTGGIAVLGLMVQLFIERRRTLKQRATAKKAKEKDKEKDKEKEKKDTPPKKPWWTLGLPMYRQAG